VELIAMSPFIVKLAYYYERTAEVNVAVLQQQLIKQFYR